MTYIDIDGCRLFYDQDGDGPTVVLIHGAAQENTVWRDVVPLLAQRYSVVAVDLPGHGKSDLCDDKPFTGVNDFADIAGRFIRALDLRPVGIVGHSLGGAVCLRLAIDLGNRIAGAVNIAGSAKSATARIGYPGDLLDLVSVNPTAWMETNFRSLLGRGLPPERKWRLAFDSKRIPPEVILGDLAAYSTCDFMNELHRISADVLCIAGEDDWSCSPERVQATSEAIGDAVPIRAA